MLRMALGWSALARARSRPSSSSRSGRLPSSRRPRTIAFTASAGGWLGEGFTAAGAADERVGGGGGNDDGRAGATERLDGAAAGGGNDDGRAGVTERLDGAAAGVDARGGNTETESGVRSEGRRFSRSEAALSMSAFDRVSTRVNRSARPPTP